MVEWPAISLIRKNRRDLRRIYQPPCRIPAVYSASPSLRSREKGSWTPACTLRLTPGQTDSSIQASRELRAQEAAVLRTLGVSRRSLIGAVTLEFALLSALGVAIAGVSASRRLFDIPPVAVLREI